jgi:hypothetical protein
MTRNRLTVMITLGTILLASVLAVALFGQGEITQKSGSGVIQYRVVAVPNSMTAAQLQAVLTTQGNAGFRFVAPFAVGAGPIPTDQVFVFSKP